MHPSGSCKCLHCGELFRPDARNRTRQRYCRTPACRKASKTASQRAWLGKKGNEDYFRGADNVARVQAWRKLHPLYWRRAAPRGEGTLQDLSKRQSALAEREAVQDDTAALQDLLRTQPPVLVGLIAHLTGSALQEDIVVMTRTLHSRGRP